MKRRLDDGAQLTVNVDAVVEMTVKKEGGAVHEYYWCTESR